MKKTTVAAASKAAAKAESPNAWGGHDYTGPKGIARTSVDDGETTVSYLNRYGHGQLLEWEATFSSGTPAAIIDATIFEALRLAGI